MATLQIKVKPNARTSSLEQAADGSWLAQLKSPPVDGKANEECVRFFAEFAAIPRSRVRIVMGLTSRTKVVEIEGVPQDALEKLLTATGAAS